MFCLEEICTINNPIAQQNNFLNSTLYFIVFSLINESG